MLVKLVPGTSCSTECMRAEKVKTPMAMKRKRQQRPKTENKGWMEAKNNHLRSNVAQPHRNKAKYRRADWRNAAQRGMVDA